MDVLLNATTRRDVAGNVVGVIGVGQDITERKQVEVEKTRVAQELQTFIDTANAPIFGIDAHGLVNEWNNKAAAITGFSRMEVLGKNLVQVTVHFEQRFCGVSYKRYARTLDTRIAFAACICKTGSKSTDATPAPPPCAAAASPSARSAPPRFAAPVRTAPHPS